MGSDSPNWSSGAFIDNNPEITMHIHITQQLLRRPIAVAIAFTASFVLPSSASAEGTVGVALAHSSSAYRSYDNDTLPVPVVAWEGERFYLRGTDIGFKLFKGRSSSFAVAVSPMLNRFRADDSSDMRMRQLNDRDFLGFAGADWAVAGSWGTFSAKAQAEITGVGGAIAEVKYSFPLPQRRLSLIPEVGVSYQSEEVVRHYYRVSAAEAARSGYRAYDPGDATTPYAGVTLLMPLGSKWTATASARRTILSDSITDSPMTDSDYFDSAVVSLIRTF